MTEFARQKTTLFLDGLLPLRQLSCMLSAITLTAIIWSSELGSYYLIGRAVWVDMSLSGALLFLVVVNFASLVPLTTGGIGTIEATAPLFLISSGIPSNPALAMVLIQHAGQYVFTTVTGEFFTSLVAFTAYRSPDPKPSPLFAPYHRCPRGSSKKPARTWDSSTPQWD